MKLEEQTQFPRILVGNGFHDYLQLNSQLPLDTPENRASREFAEICIGHICESDEHCQLYKPDEANERKTRILSLDVHSDFVAELIGEPHQEPLNKARNFAEREIQRFSGHDEKLACRYRHLLDCLGGEH